MITNEMRPTTYDQRKKNRKNRDCPQMVDKGSVRSGHFSEMSDHDLPPANVRSGHFLGLGVSLETPNHPGSLILDNIYDTLIEALLIALLAFTPLALGSVHPWSIATFEVTATLMAFLWVLKSFSQGKPKLSFSPIFSLFFVLIAFASLQFFFSRFTFHASRFTFPTTIYAWATKTELLKLIAYALIFLVTLNTIKTKQQITRILTAIITIGFITSIFYLMRYFGASAPRCFINPDHFSAYLGMIIPLSLGLILSHASRFTLHASRPLLFFSLLVTSGALFLTMSRGGMFSFIAALVFIALLVSTRRSMKNKGWIILAIAVFIVFIVAWLGATPVIERIMSVKAEIASRYFGGRLSIWQGTIGIIKDNPIFGTGLGTFNYIFPRYQPLEIIAKHYTYAHSDILELLSEIGVLGFSLIMICGLWTMVYLFLRYRQRHDPWVTGMSICVFGSLASIFIHSFTDFNLHIPANAVLLAVILALFVSILNTNSAPSLRGPKGAEAISYIASILAVGLLIVYTITAVRPAMADHYASLPIPSLRGPVGAEAISNALRLDPLNASYHYNLGNAYKGEYKLIDRIESYEKAVTLNSTNSLYHQSLALAYGALADSLIYRPDFYKKAHGEFETAISLEPNDPYRYPTYATWLFNHPTKENIEKGVEVYRKAIALDPKLADKALAEYFKVETSYAQLKQILPNTPENHYIIMDLLIKKGLWGENEADFKEDMRTASYKYPYYKAMFLYYDSKGDVSKGLEVLRDYLKLDPNCADAHFWIADRMLFIKPVNWKDIFWHHEKAITLAPDNTFYREWYARYLYLAKRYNDAIVELEKVVAKDGWNIELQHLLSDWKKTKR